ncbi:MAG: WYL domain-containing protein [Shewanella sp.]
MIQQLTVFVYTVSHLLVESKQLKISQHLTLLRRAINQQQCLTFNYKNKARQAELYQLINHSGLWYLAAVHGGQLKTFELGLIRFRMHNHLRRDAIRTQVIS